MSAKGATISFDDRSLMDMAGWPVFRDGRAIYQNGSVLKASWEPPYLRGEIQEGSRVLRSGLKIDSRLDIKNLCPCRDSQDRGIICRHAVAVALYIGRGGGPGGAPASSPVRDEARPSAREALAQREMRPQFRPADLLFEDEDSPALPEARLTLILPPNFIESWKRGQIMVTPQVEVCGNGKLQALSALQADAVYASMEDDVRVLESIWEKGGYEWAAALSLSVDEFLELLETCTAATEITLGRRQPVEIDPEPVIPLLKVTRAGEGGEGSGFNVKATLPDDAELLQGSEASWLFVEGKKLQPVTPGLPAAYQSLLRAPVFLPEEAGIRFLATELPRLYEFFQVERGEGAGDDSFEVVVPIPKVRLEIEGSLNFLEAHIDFDYPGRQVRHGDDKSTGGQDTFSLVDPDNPRRLFLRNSDYETAATRRLQGCGFSYDRTRRAWALKGQKEILAFFAGALEKLKDDWTVKIGSRFGRVTEKVEVIRPEFQIRDPFGDDRAKGERRGSGENWLELDYQMASEGGTTFRREQILRMLQVGQNSTQLGDGRLAVFDPERIEDFHEVLRDLNPDSAGGGSFRIERSQAAFLSQVLPEDDLQVKGMSPAEWRTLSRTAEGPRELELVDLGALNQTLRDYQRLGVSWMDFLSRNGFAGILADDMGLGKTLQALAFIDRVHREASENEKRPSLVICPSSLVTNWAEEAARFTPDLKVLVIEGNKRSGKLGAMEDADLIITSFALLRRDVKQHKEVSFQCIVIDEAQNIRNPDTQLAKAVFSLEGTHRFALTGTPMENSVRDLWSIMNFLMPGYLGRRDDFRQRYEQPLSQGSISESTAVMIRERLSKRMRPFMLRRRKEEVLTELPEKIEQVLHCELVPEQRELYATMVRESRKKVDEASSEKNDGRKRMIMLTALLRLRQICDDPRLVLPEPDDQTPAKRSDTTTAAKVSMLRDLLEEAIPGGHKVLVFSQFSKMLRLLADDLREQGINFAYLDGQTRDRPAQIKRFQTQDDVPVFLLSLKAGGVGLNLTAADMVVLFDPWWNPAVEAQATDRAHRMGQRRTVNVYRFITRETVEEKIASLQARKREQIKAVVDGEAAPMMSGLSMQEIEDLLSE